MTRHLIRTQVHIGRPIAEVFAFVSDPTRFPLWNSAVTSVTRATDGQYLMARELPGGHAQNGLAIDALEPPALFTLRTTSGPTPFTYRYRFSADTRIDLEAEIELSGVAGLLGPLASQAVKRGIDANLATLKQQLEARGKTE
jgi:uncharacterized protein YndB with AHSA1/START domain